MSPVRCSGFLLGCTWVPADITRMSSRHVLCLREETQIELTELLAKERGTDMGRASTAAYASSDAMKARQGVRADVSALQKFVKEIVVSNDSAWAWKNYKSVVLSLQREFD